MAKLKIRTLGDKVLRRKAEPVKKVNQNITTLLDNMLEAMREAEGVGLAAPQVGISKRVIIVDVGEGLYELINPEIVEQSGSEVAVEGCLSVPNVGGEVSRSSWVKVRGLNRLGEEFEIEATGLFARALQHEIDHLEGILFIDKASSFI
jgi:peptide deformylase